MYMNTININNLQFYGQKPIKISKEQIAQIEKFIESNMNEGEYSKIMGISRYSLSRMINQLYGKSISRIRYERLFSRYTDKVIELAKKGYTLEKISKETGLPIYQLQAIFAHTTEKSTLRIRRQENIFLKRNGQNSKPVMVNNISEYVSQGKNLKEIADIKGISAEMLYKKLKGQNIEKPMEYKAKQLEQHIKTGVLSGKTLGKIRGDLGLSQSSFRYWVDKIFGCYPKELAYKFGIKLNEKQLAEKIEYYLNQGYKVQEVAETMGLNIRKVQEIMSRNGLKTLKKRNIAKLDSVLPSFLKGERLSLEKLSENLGIKADTVINYIRRKYKCGLNELYTRAEKGTL